MTDRLDELKGAVKKTAGTVTGDEGREAEGWAEQCAGRTGRPDRGAARRRSAAGDETLRVTEPSGSMATVERRQRPVPMGDW